MLEKVLHHPYDGHFPGLVLPFVLQLNEKAAPKAIFHDFWGSPMKNTKKPS
ncbi:hypothetical protein BAOM_4830 [Peribacillus asahii]|uniref:Uncharacterized protein n=1 Tax=Peribacillus asahii TaxID=228899 RepID=A0A3T0KYM4_9BACI|nr:hypothetical protein BAOM_4830 [Peribacillus asahii]